MRLTYFHEKSFVVETMHHNEDEWTPCFNLTTIKMPTAYYLGFSAETGELSDNHDIISVETKNLYDAARRAPDSTDKAGAGKKQRKSKSSSGGGWGWFFFKLMLFGLVCGGGYVGFTMYRANKRSSRF